MDEIRKNIRTYLEAKKESEQREKELEEADALASAASEKAESAFAMLKVSLPEDIAIIESGLVFHRDCRGVIHVLTIMKEG